MAPEQDFDPPTGVAVPLGAMLRRVLAPNPSPMTFRGTNTYLLGRRGVAVIDPGPDDTAHLEAILAALQPGQRVSHVIVTHAHLDHAPLARRLARETGAPVLARGDAQAGRSAVMQTLAKGGCVAGGEGVDTAFTPDISLADAERIKGDGWTLTALWTPGHFCNHIALEYEDAIFTGDLVMGWASSLVSPPDGDLTDFMASCRRLRAHDVSVFHPGHGAPVTSPADRLDWLIAHRHSREASILHALQAGPASAQTLAGAIYTETPPALLPAATRNVLAHLIDLTVREKAAPLDKLSATARFERL